MENQPVEQNKVDGQQNPQSFQLYTGKAPWQLQIVTGMMWLSGVMLILRGIPLLIFFGIGIIPIVLGWLNIKYAKLIFKMQKKGYVGGMVILGISALSEVVSFFTADKVEGIPGNVYLIFVALSLLFVYILYSYRDKFVD